MWCSIAELNRLPRVFGPVRRPLTSGFPVANWLATPTLPRAVAAFLKALFLCVDVVGRRRGLGLGFRLGRGWGNRPELPPHRATDRLSAGAIEPVAPLPLGSPHVSRLPNGVGAWPPGSPPPTASTPRCRSVARAPCPCSGARQRRSLRFPRSTRVSGRAAPPMGFRP